MALDRQNYGTAIDMRFSFDAAGNVLSVKDQPTGAAATQDNQCFGYDGLQRLSVAWTAGDADCGVAQNAIDDSDVGGVAPYWTEYGYDPVGNRTSLIEHGLGSASDSVTTYTQAGAGPHQVTGTLTSTGGNVTSAAYTYDNSGRRASTTTGGVTTDYTWDAESKLVGLGDDSNVYDAAGNRLARTDESGVTVYLGGQELQIEGSEVTATRYYSFAGKTVAVRTSGGLGGVSSLVTDPQGSVIASVPNTDWSPSSVQRIFTDPFGAARDGSSSSVPGDRRFLGAVQDAGSRLVLLGARFYDETSGRFISVDPVLDPDIPAQFNAYSYAWNNPVTRSDPTGLAPLGSGDSGCQCTTPRPKGKGKGGGQPGAGKVSGTNQQGQTPNQQLASEIGDGWAGQLAAQYPIGAIRDKYGIIRTTAEPPQLIGGYYDVYDDLFREFVDMKEGKFDFEYAGNSYVLWAWKGDYPSWGAGGEIGFYWQEGLLKDAGERWHADPNVAGLPLMSVSVTSISGGKIGSFAPETPQVWPGVWNSNVQDSRSSDLRIEATVAFTDPGMFEAFYDSPWRDDPRWTFNTNTDTATLRFRKRRGVR